MDIDDLKSIATIVARLKAIKIKLALLQDKQWETVSIRVQLAGQAEMIVVDYDPQLDPSIRDVIMSTLRTSEVNLTKAVRNLIAKDDLVSEFGGTEVAAKKSKRAVEV